MTNPIATYTPEDVLRGVDVKTKSILLKATTVVIPALTPLKRDADFKAIPATSITDTVIGLTVPLEPGSGFDGLVGNPISTEDSWVPMYVEADINAAAVNFDFITDADTDLKKDSIFDGTEIILHFDKPGF